MGEKYKKLIEIFLEQETDEEVLYIILNLLITENVK